MALLASVMLTPDTLLWTLDRDLGVLANHSKVLFTPSTAK